MTSFLFCCILLIFIAYSANGFQIHSFRTNSVTTRLVVGRNSVIRPLPTTTTSSKSLTTFMTEQNTDVNAAPKEKLHAKDLFKKYGIAYLATSITLAIISYLTCYYCVSKGIDVASLLAKFGIKATAMAESTGTASIAYVFHKAASPIRFPPTLALTPIVANLMGRKPKVDNNDEVKK